MENAVYLRCAQPVRRTNWVGARSGIRTHNSLEGVGFADRCVCQFHHPGTSFEAAKADFVDTLCYFKCCINPQHFNCTTFGAVENWVRMWVWGAEVVHALIWKLSKIAGGVAA
jgi:hypothetical protein